MVLWSDTHRATEVASSGQVFGRVDFLVGDFQLGGTGEYYPGIVPVEGPGSVALVWSAGGTLATGTSSGPFLFGTQAVVRIWDVTLEVGQRYLFEVDALSADVDLGFALFQPNGAGWIGSRADNVAWADENGAGGDESLSWAPPWATQTYGLAVWSNGLANGAASAVVRVNISQDYDGLASNDPRAYDADPGLFRLDQTQSRWSVVALRPSAGDDWDLDLWDDAFGLQRLERSSQGQNGSDRVELVAVDFETAALGAYFPKATLVASPNPAPHSYRLEWEQEEGALDLTREWSLYQIAAGDVATCVDVPLVGGVEYTFDLRWSDGGGADAGMALFQSYPDDGFRSRGCR